MTLDEFSAEFDILYNNVGSAQSPGLNEYEKSIFLTKAQSEIVKSYFTPVYNKAQSGFDGSRKRQYDFSSLIKVSTLFNVNTVQERITDSEKLDRRSIVYVFPQDYFLSVNELLYDGTTQYSVIPINYEEYQRVMMKPYAYPHKKAAWRLFTNKKSCNAFSEYAIHNLGTYSFLSTWADQDRTLAVTVKWKQNMEVTAEGTISNKFISFYSESLEGTANMTIEKSSWDKNKLIYEISILVESPKAGRDDADVFTAVQEGFSLLLQSHNDTQYIYEDLEVSKVARKLDMFKQATAPSKFTKTSESDHTGQLTGYTFETKLIQLPLAEIVGKFKNEPTYQLRYVKKPAPIVLTDLEDVSIEGVYVATECSLPTELHEEILQRAVELAKAAYLGDLNSQIGVGSTSATEKGVVPQQQSRQ